MPPKSRQNRLDATFNLDMLPSISRSGGSDDPNGDSLKDRLIQEKFREYIETILVKYESNIETSRNLTLDQDDIIRRFRKLREGVIASHRSDSFAGEVYETSLFLAAAYNSTDQIRAISDRIWTPSRTKQVKTPNESLRLQPREITIIVILLFHQLMASKSPLPRHLSVRSLFDSATSGIVNIDRLRWLKSLALAMNSGNFHSARLLLIRKNVRKLLDGCISAGKQGVRELAAVDALVDRILQQICEAQWIGFRYAYREERESWILRVLDLPSPHDAWIESKQRSQEFTIVPGSPTRWRIYKPKAVHS